ncbi:MAG TPA: hypothetical protein PLL10_07180, partial [Elusimicrobiales bacterium]|nr:hypothetical protein [Elusimicrobiales bacterium]
QSRESYLAGSFGVQPWSEAVALPHAHAVVVYHHQSVEELRRVLTHELSHLFFGSFFLSKPDALPTWLDEGMATNMEDVVLGQRLSVLRETDPKSFPNFETFVVTIPSRHDSESVVGMWYQQAFGTVRFMSSNSNKLKFVSYCKKLLAGSPPERALWEVYKIRNWKLFDERWRQWLEQEQADEQGQGGGAASSRFQRSGMFSNSSEFFK